jgi:predicted DNA repair protein MutK
MVGTAGARALNEVVRQETGEGIVPKLRQALGTAPRTGVASPTRVGPQPLVQQIRPLTQAQRTEQQRQQNRSEAQRQFDLMRERFNPRRGEFGISEAVRGLGALFSGR